MPLHIEHLEAERLAHALAEATGELLGDAVIAALRERLDRVTRERETASLRADLRRIQQHFVATRRGDHRTPDEIIGYDEGGLPA